MAIKTKTQSNKLPHLLIDAGPGCGKSTTCLASFDIMKGKKPAWFESATDEQRAIWKAMDGTYSSIGFQAFNKSIAEELQAKVPHNVKAQTFHSFGYAALRQAGYNIKMSQKNTQFFIREQLGYTKKDDQMTKEHFQMMLQICKLVGLLKNNLLEATDDNVRSLALQFQIEINGNVNRVVELCESTIEFCKDVKKTGTQWIDFDDMIWLPIVLDLDFSGIKKDLLVCDESQDLNAVQHELIVRSGCRLVCVGDPRQAIYGFRGADSDSMTTLKNILENTDRGVEVLPLQVSFRLPKSGVANVQEYAPELRATDDAIEGEIRNQFTDEMLEDLRGGDLVVSRINKNIFVSAFQLIRKGVACRIQGRDFADQLLKILKKECNLQDDGEAMTVKLLDYSNKETDRIEKKIFKDSLLDMHNEKMDTLFSLIAGCETCQAAIDKIESLFSGDLPRDEVVLLSTVHRAKGLEADRVFFLEPSLVPHPMSLDGGEEALKQEYNLKFVAETRHKEVLTYVHVREEEEEEEDERNDA